MMKNNMMKNNMFTCLVESQRDQCGHIYLNLLKII
jgi:hypothetical protein